MDILKVILRSISGTVRGKCRSISIRTIIGACLVTPEYTMLWQYANVRTTTTTTEARAGEIESGVSGGGSSGTGNWLTGSELCLMGLGWMRTMAPLHP